MKRIAIACGGRVDGTPGIALSQSLYEQGDESWLFISKKFDSRLSRKYSSLQFVPTPGAALVRTPMGVFRFTGVWLSFLKAYSFCQKRNNAIVVFGIYFTGPPWLPVGWVSLSLLTRQTGP